MSTFDQLIDRSWSSNQLFSVLLELTYRCNLDCFFCYNDLGLGGTPLSFQDYDRLLRDLAALNVLTVVLSGGEPLAHPHFFRIGALARELGFVVRIKSNGHALNASMAQRLRYEVDPYVVEVSLHGATAATHDRQTRVPGSFERLVANIPQMLAAGLRVKVNSTLTRWNEQECEAMYALTDALGVTLRFDLQVSPRDNGDRTPLEIAPSREGIERLMRLDDQRAGSRSSGPPVDENAPPAAGKHCGAGSSGIAVDPFGNVYPCVQWRRPVANLHERSVRELWGEPSELDAIRQITTDARDVVARHPRGKLLNFCPGLAEMLTGSPVKVPAEMERQAAIVAAAVTRSSDADAAITS